METLITLIGLLAATASAANTPPEPPAMPYGAAGVRAYISPALEMEADQGALPGARYSLNESVEGLVPIQRPDGVVMIDLQGRFQSASIATIIDGEIVVSCADPSHDHLTRPHTAPAAAPER